MHNRAEKCIIGQEICRKYAEHAKKYAEQVRKYAKYVQKYAEYAKYEGKNQYAPCI